MDTQIQTEFYSPRWGPLCTNVCLLHPWQLGYICHKNVVKLHNWSLLVTECTAGRWLKCFIYSVCVYDSTSKQITVNMNLLYLPCGDVHLNWAQWLLFQGSRELILILLDDYLNHSGLAGWLTTHLPEKTVDLFLLDPDLKDLILVCAVHLHFLLYCLLWLILFSSHEMCYQLGDICFYNFAMQKCILLYDCI